jgi:polysaccharide transporter, PST family
MIRAVMAHARRPFARTAVGLYAVQATILLIPLATLPYLTRVLGPSAMGLLLFSQALASVLTTAIEFGFEVTASRSVARRPGDREASGRLSAEVLSAKLLLVALSIPVAVLAWLAVPLLRDNPEYVALAWLLAVAQGFSPLWFFLGSERVGAPAAIDIGSKVVAAAGVFVVVRDGDDGVLVLALQAGAALAAAALGLVLLARRAGLGRPSLRLGLAGLRDSAHIGVFRLVSGASVLAPSLIVGLLSSAAQVGYWGVADKVYRAPNAALWPLSQALYPSISRLRVVDDARASRVVRAAVAGFVAVGIVLALLLAAAAEPLVDILFGEDFGEASSVLTVLAFSLPLVLLGHTLTYQVLMPLDRDRAANSLGLVGLGSKVAIALALVPAYGALGAAWATLGSSVVYAVVACYFVARASSRPARLAAVDLDVR